MTRSFFFLLGLLTYAISLFNPSWATSVPAIYDPIDLSLTETSSYSLSKRSSSAKSTKAAAGGVAEEIINFMQVIMEGGIQSQQCWVTLVNATQSDLGTCLGLSTFSTLVVQGSNSSFATAVDDYLTDMCGGTKCDATTIKYWKYKIQKDCSAGDDLKQPLLKSLGVVMDNYESSLYDLACKVHFNGTAPYCLSEVLNSTQTTNSKDFFNNLLTGTNVNWYSQSFFQQPARCMHEIYKAAMFLIPGIRSFNEVTGLGVVLSTCPGTDLAWTDICDMQKPAALSVEAAAADGTRSRSAGFSTNVDRLLYAGLMAAAAMGLLL